MTAQRRRVVGLSLFFAAFFSIGLQFHNARFGTGFESFAIARNLVQRGQYANPFDVVTGPTAHMAPLYPWFLALLLLLFPSGAGFATAISICHMAAHGLHAALLPRLSSLFFRDPRPGIWAAAAQILLPVIYFFPHSEGIFCALGLMLFCLATDRRLSRGGAGGAIFTGLFAGLLALLNPMCVPVCALWLGYLWWRRRVAFPRPSALLIALTFVVTLAPWTWRNYQEFHSLFFVRDNLGLELYVSNNDFAQADIVRNMPSGLRSFHPASSAVQAEAVRELGEVEYNRRCMSAALRWMREHPRRFLTLTLIRAGLFWFPDAEGFTAVHGFAIGFLTVEAVAGLALLARRRARAGVFLAAVMALYPLIYYFVQIDARYRVPILWVSMLSMGYAACAAAAAFRKPVVRLNAVIPPLHLLE